MEDVQVGGGQVPISLPDMLAASTSYYIVSDPPPGGGSNDAGGMGSGDGMEIRLTNVSNGSLTDPGPLQAERVQIDSDNSNHHWSIVFNPENRRYGSPIHVEAVSSSFPISIAGADGTEGNYFELRPYGFSPDDPDAHRLNVERTESTGDHQGKFHLLNARTGKYMCLADDWETAGTGQHVKQYGDKAGRKAVWHIRKVRP